MIHEELTVEKASEEGVKLPYAYIRTYSHLHLGYAPDQVEVDEIIEARFFDETKEIRIFQRNGTLCAASVMKENGDKLIKSEHGILNQEHGKLWVEKYLETDEDGQTYIADMRLVDWKEGK